MKRKDNCDNLLTDNQIGDKGVRTISEMLQVNTTLTALNLSSEGERREKMEWNGMNDYLSHRQLDWRRRKEISKKCLG